jgi:guanyl-specific ribonuclease Sa
MTVAPSTPADSSRPADPSHRARASKPPRRRGSALALLIALTVGALLGPAVIAPATAPAAEASVFSTCTTSRCADARAARSGWQSLGYPTASGWYAWPAGRFNFTGGQFFNREGQLPAGATYNEYDVYPRNRGAARDAFRIVVNRSSGTVWFSPNHYLDFYRL